MPKLWNATIAAHRRDVRDAILDTTAALVAQHGLRSPTMSQIAERTGIGRATLYKYFPSVEAIMFAWHERHVGDHFAHLVAIANHAGSAAERLNAVLEAYARVAQPHLDIELGRLLHRGEHIAETHRHLFELVRDLLAEGVDAGDIRADVSPDELASYCLHAITAAGTLQSPEAVRRLVGVILSGLSTGASPPPDNRTHAESFK